MRSFIAGLSVIACLAIVGCGDSGPVTAPVTGKVTFDGASYKNAIITFSPEGGGPSAIGKSNEAGEYELFTGEKRGAVLGQHKVSVTTEIDASAEAERLSQLRSDDPEYQKLMAEAARGKSSGNQPPKEPLPAKYNKTTELKFEVKSGRNVINLDLVK